MDGLQPGAMPNYDITWETVENWDLGLDYGLFDNKLTGEFSVWGKTRKDILGERLGSTPSTLGASLPAVNYAQQSLNGFEISASYKINWENLITKYMPTWGIQLTSGTSGTKQQP